MKKLLSLIFVFGFIASVEATINKAQLLRVDSLESLETKEPKAFADAPQVGQYIGGLFLKKDDSWTIKEEVEVLLKNLSKEENQLLGKVIIKCNANINREKSSLVGRIDFLSKYAILPAADNGVEGEGVVGDGAPAGSRVDEACGDEASSSPAHKEEVEQSNLVPGLDNGDGHSDKENKQSLFGDANSLEALIPEGEVVAGGDDATSSSAHREEVVQSNLVPGLENGDGHSDEDNLNDGLPLFEDERSPADLIPDVGEGSGGSGSNTDGSVSGDGPALKKKRVTIEMTANISAPRSFDSILREDISSLSFKELETKLANIYKNCSDEAQKKQYLDKVFNIKAVQDLVRDNRQVVVPATEQGKNDAIELITVLKDKDNSLKIKDVELSFVLHALQSPAIEKSNHLRNGFIATTVLLTAIVAYVTRATIVSWFKKTSSTEEPAAAPDAAPSDSTEPANSQPSADVTPATAEQPATPADSEAQPIA